MSTVDPDTARRERDRRTPTVRDLAVPAVVVFVMPALAACALSRMLANAIRNDVFDGASIVALVLAFPGSAVTVLAIIRWVTLSARNPRLLGISSALGLVLLGVAVGRSVAAVPPAWAAAPSLTAEVAIVGAIGIGMLGFAGWARRRRIRMTAREDAIVRSSDPVTGVVTDRGYDVPSGEASVLLATVTYAFVDAAGIPRFVRKQERLPMNDLVVGGEKVDLWYDRQDASNEAGIVIRRRSRKSGER